jgi:hypothetical protein
MTLLNCPWVIKIKFDLNKNSSMFEVNYITFTPELSVVTVLNCPD